MPRACFLLDHFWGERSGGAEWQTFVLCRALREAGWEVHYISESLTGKRGRTVEAHGIQVHWLTGLQWRSRLHPSQRDMARTVFALLDEIGPDVIYSRGNNAFSGMGLTHRYRETRSVKLAWGAAADWEISRDFYRQRLAYYQKAWWKKRLLWLDACVKDRDHAAEIQHADQVIVQTESQLQAVRMCFGKESTVLPSSHLVPAVLPKKAHPPTVIFVAHIGRRKRVELFVHLAKQCADLDVRFLVVGDFTDARYETEVRTGADGLDNLEFLGPLSAEETNQRVAESALLVSTTDPGREGYPNVFIQAWLRQTPVASLEFDPDSVLERHEFLGLRPRTMERMVSGVCGLLSQHERLDRMGERAREWAAQRHGYEANRERIVRIFQGLATGTVL